VTDRVTEEQLQDQKADRPYPLLWYLVGAFSAKITVPGMCHVIENSGLARHGVAVIIAMVCALFIGGTIIFIGFYRFALAVLWAAFILSLWRYSR
jgi:hypothetical protein